MPGVRTGSRAHRNHDEGARPRPGPADAGKESPMPAWICATCGVQYPDTDEPPPGCPICQDERQYVHWGGQRWTTTAELARERTVVLREEEPGLIGVGVEPSF